MKSISLILLTASSAYALTVINYVHAKNGSIPGAIISVVDHYKIAGTIKHTYKWHIKYYDQKHSIYGGVVDITIPFDHGKYSISPPHCGLNRGIKLGKHSIVSVNGTFNYQTLRFAGEGCSVV